MIWTLSRELKLVGFLINICASLLLIGSVLFGKGRPPVKDCITGRQPWQKLWGTTWYDVGNQNINALITSALVIIGSSMQMAADLFDP
jgi:hypothetical protein